MKPLIRGIILLLAVALLCAACGQGNRLATRHTSEASRESGLLELSAKSDRSTADSLYYTSRNLREEMTELRETFSETVPASVASLTIPAGSLIDLPDGAKYGASEGRATVEIQRLGDTFVATGRCDSVARQCARYERQVSRQRNSIDSLNSVVRALDSRLAQMTFESRSNSTETNCSATVAKASPSRGGRWLAAGAAIGVVATTVVLTLWRRLGAGMIIRNLFRKLFKSFS